MPYAHDDHIAQAIIQCLYQQSHLNRMHNTLWDKNSIQEGEDLPSQNQVLGISVEIQMSFDFLAPKVNHNLQDQAHVIIALPLAFYIVHSIFQNHLLELVPTLCLALITPETRGLCGI